MHTESEAKTKRCPFAVASHTDPRRGFHETSHPRVTPTHPCIASKCMAWRWSSAKGLTYRPQESLSGIGTAYGTSWAEPQRPAFINAEWKWDSTRGVWHTGAPSDAVGFCSLSGSTTP